jgi:hypothetical protein
MSPFVSRFAAVWATGASLVVVSAFVPGVCAAQSVSDLHLGTWGGAMDLAFGLERDRTHASDGTLDIESKSRRAREGFTIRNEGAYFVNPGLAAANLALSLGWTQDREFGNGTPDSHRATLVGYALDANIFAALPYNGTLYANRTRNLLYAPFSRSEVAFENRGAIFRLREDSPLKERGWPYLSATLTAEQQHTRETTTSALGQAFSSDEQRTILRADARKGFETADLALHYEFANIHDSTIRNATFRTQSASLDYSLDFGPTLNRRSDTRLYFSTRSGENPINTFTVNQSLHIDHLENLSTGYRYLLTRTDTQAGAPTAQSASFDLTHVLYRNLTTTGQLAASHQDVPAGTLDSASGQLGFKYQRALPWNGKVFAGTSGRATVNDNRLQSSQINVTDEGQSAPPALGAGAGFLLNQSFVVASSIVVVDTRGGARLPTALGADYEVFPEGNLYRIVPLATSAVIQAGDPLAISYTYEVDPALKYRSTSRAVNIGVNFNWISLSIGHEVTDQTAISGQSHGFLQDLRRDTAQLELRGAWNAFQGQANVGTLRHDSTRLAYTERRYGELFSYRPARALAFSLRADRTMTDFTLPVHQTDARSAQLTLDWYAPGGWTTTALLARRVYKDSLQPMETINEASLKARLVYGLLDFTSALTASDRTRGGFETAIWRLAFTAIRRF